MWRTPPVIAQGRLPPHSTTLDSIRKRESPASKVSALNWWSSSSSSSVITVMMMMTTAGRQAEEGLLLFIRSTLRIAQKGEAKNWGQWVKVTPMADSILARRLRELFLFSSILFFFFFFFKPLPMRQRWRRQQLPCYFFLRHHHQLFGCNCNCCQCNVNQLC